MKIVIIGISLLMVIQGCSLIPHSTQRYKNHLNSHNGKNINDLIEITAAAHPYKVEYKGKYKWYYEKVIFRAYNALHTHYTLEDCRYIYITTLKNIIIDNTIQTPETCKSGFSGVF